MAKDHWEVVPADSPERCQGSFPGTGIQCRIRRMPGSNYCVRHAHSNIGPNGRQNQLQLYRLQKYQQRLEELNKHPDLKSLNNEIGILRMALENVINECRGDDTLFLMYTSKVSDLVSKISQCIKDCHKLEASMGKLVNRDYIINLSEEIISIISRHVENPEVMENIANEIVTAFDQDLENS